MWKSVRFNAQNIQTETAKAVLINMPHSSEYDGYSFWHPSKLVRSGSHSYEKTLSYTDDFTFKLKKFGKGKYNKFDVIDELEIGAEEIEEIFELVDNNKKNNGSSYVKVSEPEAKQPKEETVAEELKA